jgi:hypothetical protein
MPGGLLHVFELHAVFERHGGERIITLRSVGDLIVVPNSEPPRAGE